MNYFGMGNSIKVKKNPGDLLWGDIITKTSFQVWREYWPKETEWVLSVSPLSYKNLIKLID